LTDKLQRCAAPAPCTGLPLLPVTLSSVLLFLSLSLAYHLRRVSFLACRRKLKKSWENQNEKGKKSQKQEPGQKLQRSIVAVSN